jgi:hypothetical protein
MSEPTKAYILIQTQRGRTGVADRLRAIPGVIVAVDVTGPYDVLALAGAASAGNGIDDILDAARDVPGVLRAIAAPLIATDAGAPIVDAA